MSKRTVRAGLAAGTLVLSGVAAIAAAPPASAKPDTDCMRAGIATLKEKGVFSQVARDGLPISLAVAVGVTPRPGTDLSTVPDPIPLPVVLADHRAGSHSLFIYPWC